MNVPDTSVLIAGFDSTHPSFVSAARALGETRRSGVLVSHTIAETFAVLSAPGGPYPATTADVLAYLDQFLTRKPVGLSPGRYPAAVRELAAAGVSGGAVYDGLIAIAARQSGADLVSLDARASQTYQRVGARFSLLS